MDDPYVDGNEEPRNPDGTPGELGGAALAQFQRAALDAVHAARTLLDAAESVIREPAAVEAMVDTVTAFARSATEAVGGFAASGRVRDDTDTGTDPGDADGFQQIPVE